MKTTVASVLSFGLVWGAQLIPSDPIERAVSLLGLLLLLLNTYLEWRRRQSSS